MDSESKVRKEKMRRLREKLLVAELDLLSGKKGYTVEEVVAAMRKAISNATSGKANCTAVDSDNT